MTDIIKLVGVSMFPGPKSIRAALLAVLLTSPSVFAETVHFEKDVAPIFQANCTACHGTQVKLKDLNLATEEAALKGSESGPVVVHGKPEESLLYKKIQSGAMPVGKPHLSEKEIAIISSWIRGDGAAGETVQKVDNSPLTQDDVIPIFLTRCTVCHGLRKQEAGLDLRSKASMLKGGKSGPAIVLGKPEDSLLIKRIKAGEMPPKQKLIVVDVKPITPGPVPPENVDVLAEVRRQSPVPIATGERLVTRHQFRDIFEKLACNVIQPDLCHCGGLWEAKKIAAMAEVSNWHSSRKGLSLFAFTRPADQLVNIETVENAVHEPRHRWTLPQ
jgi:mono/diheme cytochrome c family protein